MNEQLSVLQASVDRLAALVGPLTADELRAHAYPSEWTVADVLSHLGSGAIIHRRRLEAVLAGEELDTAQVRAIWDEWNAMSPEDQRSEAVRADRALLERLGSLSDEDRARFRFVMGPFDLDFDGYVGLRLNEHVLHTWDVAVSFDAAATLPDDAVETVLGSLQRIVGFAGKPTGADRMITVLTIAPASQLGVALRPDSVTLTSGLPDGTADLELPAEAFIRLVYGRLDPDHTPAVRGAEGDLDELRRAFPGI